MRWDVEYSDRFGEWWAELSEDEVLYAFDPRRVAILLLGGDKTGDARWYEREIPIADRLYDEHLAELGREGAPDGT